MFQRTFSLVSSMSRWERWTLLILSALLILSFVGLLRIFYVKNTVLVPTTGGTYIEGSVGALHPLNPWFVVQNDVNRDIISLVFAGLLKYNPQTKLIEEDLATLETSADRKTYTVRLKDGLQWHDSTPESPHPVTADDVMFTFKTIQDPQFTNKILQQNFRGVAIEKIDNRTVRFRLDQAYSFFPSNLTLGLLPESSFKEIPVRKLDQALDFGFQPVGAGPYRFKSIVQTDLSSEVTLERFPRPLEPTYLLERIVFRIFPDYSTLLSDLRMLQGVRLVAKTKKGEPVIPRRFRAREYTLPQYVALFFNLERPTVQDGNLRLGLQLGTNKQQIAESIFESKLVDTPLLEIDASDWRYHFDLDAAQGALFVSQWHLPEKLRLQHLLEIEDANRTGLLRAPSVVYLQTGASLTLTGSIADIPLNYSINGVRLRPNSNQSGSWIVALPTTGTGALRMGQNILRVTSDQRRVEDSFYLYRAANRQEYQQLQQERALVRRFAEARRDPKTMGDTISALDFYLDDGVLRRRTDKDPVGIRRNVDGELLTLTLLTSPSPPEYSRIAESVKEQWAVLGVQLNVEVPASREEFLDRMLQRDYDVLLFGQSLLDNLDSYPYWHSSMAQRLTRNPQDLRSDAFNLSQYASSRADGLLEIIRRTTDEKKRTESLAELRELLKKDVPAIFLYSPVYTFAHHQDIQGIELGHLSLHSDRFLTLHRWYVRQRREFLQGKNWWSFFTWLPSFAIKSGN